MLVRVFLSHCETTETYTCSSQHPVLQAGSDSVPFSSVRTQLSRARLHSSGICFGSVSPPRLFLLRESGRRGRGSTLRLRNGAVLHWISPDYLTKNCFLGYTGDLISYLSLLSFPPFLPLSAPAPSVPPKPPHLLALGQDKKPKRIPPAPSRPLPAPPPPPKPKPSQTQPVLVIQKEAQKVGLLIERFENSRYCMAGFLLCSRSVS